MKDLNTLQLFYNLNDIINNNIQIFNHNLYDKVITLLNVLLDLNRTKLYSLSKNIPNNNDNILEESGYQDDFDGN